MGARRVLVVGRDEHHAARLEEAGRVRGVLVESLLDHAAVRQQEHYDVPRLLRHAEQEYADKGEVVGITSYWDLPASAIAAVLAERHGLPTPGLRAVVAVEHKYWNRCIQQEVVPEMVPRFELVDPHDPEAADRVTLPFPFWIKPIKSSSGHLGMRVGDRRQLRTALAALRGGTDHLGHPLQQLVDRVEMPHELADVPGTAAIAEELLDGQQVTVEGYVSGGEVEVYATFDIHREDNGITFADYTYPSSLPAVVQRRMADAAGRLMRRIGWDHAAFNIEFFHEAGTDRIRLLEVNPRISQEHADLMGWVDGVTNLEMMVDLAMGRRPPSPRHEGPYAAAAKFFLRAYVDGTVTRVPRPRTVEEVEQAFAPCRIQLKVQQGTRLASLLRQEPYSYELAYVHLGGDDHQQLRARYRDVVDALGIEVTPADSTDGTGPVRVDATRAATLRRLGGARAEPA